MNWIVSCYFLINWGILKQGITLLLIVPVTLGTTAVFTFASTPTSTYASTHASLQTSAQALTSPTKGVQTVVWDTVPKPSSVGIKSALLPGWGQAVNQQYLKIPLIYGTLATIMYFAMQQHRFYEDYRAAYYNRTSPIKDLRFGVTPISLEALPPDLLRYKRNAYRNRRDMSVVVLAAAWGLNVVDAYVFAHMRDFDVGPDLSASFAPQFEDLPDSGPVYRLKISIPLTK